MYCPGNCHLPPRPDFSPLKHWKNPYVFFLLSLIFFEEEEKEEEIPMSKIKSARENVIPPYLLNVVSPISIVKQFLATCFKSKYQSIPWSYIPIPISHNEMIFFQPLHLTRKYSSSLYRPQSTWSVNEIYPSSIYPNVKTQCMGVGLLVFKWW